MFKEVSIFVILVFTTLVISCSDSGNLDDNQLEQKLAEHKKVLESDPDNCFSLGQVARIYQTNKEYNLAIIHFEKLLNNCPDDISSRSQYGITILLSGDRERGLNQMRQAINLAKEKGEDEYAAALEEDYVAWENFKLSEK